MRGLVFRYAAMNAGKSAALLLSAYNYDELGLRVEVFTTKEDVRFGVGGEVVSRMGLRRSAHLFDANTDFVAWLGEREALPDALLVDEAQFLSAKQVHQLQRIAHDKHMHASGKNPMVICYGLRSDFKGEPFVGASHLLAISDQLEELQTLCGCGNIARMNIRLGASGERLTEGAQMHIGAAQYKSVCPDCFYN